MKSKYISTHLRITCLAGDPKKNSGVAITTPHASKNMEVYTGLRRQHRRVARQSSHLNRFMASI